MFRIQARTLSWFSHGKSRNEERVFPGCPEADVQHARFTIEGSGGQGDTPIFSGDPTDTGVVSYEKLPSLGIPVTQNTFQSPTQMTVSDAPVWLPECSLSSFYTCHGPQHRLLDPVTSGSFRMDVYRAGVSGGGRGANMMKPCIPEDV